MPATVPTVQQAQARPGGLYLLVDGFCATSRPNRPLLDASICVLLDGDSTGGHFHATYSAYWSGNPADSSAPGDMPSCTDSPVVATLLEHYTAMYPVQAVQDMPVPSEEDALEAWPVLAAHRKAGLPPPDELK